MASRRVSLAHVTLAILVGALVWVRWGSIRTGIWIDLDVYIRGAAALLRNEPLYGISVEGQPFTYPPFAALVFVPLELMGNVDARIALTLVSLGCYVLVVQVCARRLRMNLWNAGLVGMLGLAFEPFLRNVLLGQINLLLVAMIVLDCLVVPARYRGMLIGVAAGIKLVPGAFILFLVLKREWGAAVRCIAAFAVTVAVGAMFAPRDSWTFWSGGFINLSRFGAEAVIMGDNQSLNGALLRLSRYDTSPAPILVLLLSVLAMALAVAAAKRQMDSGHDVGALVCIAFGSLLASPISWTHHWVWAVPALLILVQARHRIASGLMGTIFVIGPMWFAPRGQLLELSHNWWQVAVCLSYVVVGLIFLITLATRRHASQRAAAPPSAEPLAANGQTADDRHRLGPFATKH